DATNIGADEATKWKAALGLTNVVSGTGNLSIDAATLGTETGATETANGKATVKLDGTQNFKLLGKDGITVKGSNDEGNKTLTFGLDETTKAAIKNIGKSVSDGRDGKDATNGTNGANGTHGLTGKDGLNGKDLTTKVNALRNGEAGTVVFTDKDGNRLVKANDGNYYKAEFVSETGEPQVKDGVQPTAVVEADIELRVVDSKGETKNTSIKLSNVADGKIGAGSKDAINGSQIKNVLDKIGVTTDADGNIVAPTITAIKGKDGKDGAATTSVVAGLNKIIETVNSGIKYDGDLGTEATQQLGSKFSVVRAAKSTVAGYTPLTETEGANTINYVGDNVITKYTLDTATGNGKLEIGFKESPTFKDVTADKVKAGEVEAGTAKVKKELTFDDGTGKPTTIVAGDGKGSLLINGKKVATSESAPVLYTDATGNVVEKALDGKIYKVADLEGKRYDKGTNKYYADNQFENGVLKADAVAANLQEVPATEVKHALAKLNDNAVTGGSVLSNVAAGVANTDAVNVGQLNAVKESPITFQGDKATDTVTRKLGETLKITGDGIKVSKNATNDGLVLSIDKGKVQTKNVADQAVTSAKLAQDARTVVYVTQQNEPVELGADNKLYKSTDLQGKTYIASTDPTIPSGYYLDTDLNPEKTAPLTGKTPATLTAINPNPTTAGGQQLKHALNGYVPGGTNVTTKSVLTNVGAGEVSETSTDAINGSQFHELKTNTIKLTADGVTPAAGGNKIDTVTTALGLDNNGGISFGIKGADGIETTATGTDVTVKLSKAVTDKLKNITAVSDGKDGKATNGTDGSNGSHGLTGKDGLNGKDLTTKVNALRNGEAGTVVYTDAEGNRLVKANDGYYYEKSKVNEDGSLVNTADAIKKANDGKYYLANQVDTAGNVINTAGGVSPTPVAYNPELRVVNEDGTTTAPNKLSNIADGKIDATSKDAINGSQIKNVLDKMGVEIDPTTGEIKQPEITAIKGKDGKDGTATTSVVAGLNEIIKTVNSGIKYAGDSGSGTQQLGSTFSVNAATGNLNKDAEPTVNYVGDNLITKYTLDAPTGNGKLEIGLKESPTFKNVTADNLKANTQVESPKVVIKGKAGADGAAGKDAVLTADNNGNLKVGDKTITAGPIKLALGGKTIAADNTEKISGGKDTDKVDLSAGEKLEVVGKDGVTVDIAGKSVTLGLDKATTDKLKNITAVSDGKDGKDAKDGTNGANGTHGLTAKDGLNGKDLTTKVNALRNGEAGTVVFTDKDGNRLVKANDGNYYKADKVNDNGTLKNEADAIKKANDGNYYLASQVGADGNVITPEGGAKPAPQEYSPELRVVNNDGTTTNPIALNNIASALEAVREPNKAVTPEKAQEAVKALLAKTAGLDKAVNLADLQAVAQAGLDFKGNTGTVHRALGTALNVVGQGTPAADFAGANGNINVEAREVEDETTKAKITKLEIQLAKALQNIESIQNGDTKVTLGKDGVSVSGKDGKATVGINGGNGTDGASVTVNGKDGKDGVTIKGTDGTNGSSIVVNGTDGKPGVTINGGNGTDGKDASITFTKDGDKGTGSITGLKDPELENGKPKDPTAATTVNYVTNQIEGAKTEITNNIKNIVDGGMTYNGNSGDAVKVTLNKALNIKGEGDYTGTGSATGNIAVVGNNKDSTLEIKLNKDLKNIDSISSKDNATKIALGENGVSISGKDGKATVGINGGNGTNGASVVINGKDGQNGKDGVTIKGSDGTNGSSVSVNGKDGKDGVTIKGADGKDGSSIVVNGKDGKPGVTINGGNGTDGATVTFGKKDDGTGTGSITGLKDPDKTDKTAAATVNYVNNEINNVTNNINNAVDKMNKGLNFVGNDNEKVNAKLDGTVSIKGEGTVPTGTNTAANNIKVEKDTTDKSTGLVVKLADKLTGMTGFETKDDSDGKVKIDKTGVVLTGKDGKDGVTIKPGNGTDAATISFDKTADGKATGTITGVKTDDKDKTSVATVEYVESKMIGSGMTFGADDKNQAQKLGSTLEVKSATEKITAAVKEEKNGKIVEKAGATTTYTGKNLTTTYTINDDKTKGTISVAMSERPEFEKVTVGTGDKKMTLDGTAGSIEFAKSNPTKQVYADNNGNIIKYKDENGEIKVIERNVGTGSVTGLKDVETVTVDGEKVAVDRTQAATAGYVDEKVADVKNEVRTVVNQVDKNAQRIEEVNKQAKEGIASVAAMATLDFNDAPVGRVGVGAAIGGYRGTQAVAVGAVYGINESFKVNAKMGIPTSRPNGATYGVSATYYFDR
ncbi:YadA-like family protein, partial [Fusobacterium massiliense]|uniref:YadA-like family protein n=1 Tax=Fusobacterium massiliense TaxID=1852365 RepID=UPI0028E6F9B8